MLFLGKTLCPFHFCLLLDRGQLIRERICSINRHLLACLYKYTSADSRVAVVSYWRKYVHQVLVNRLGGLSLPRKSVVRLTDCPDMTLDVYGGRKIIKQQQQLYKYTGRAVALLRH